MRWRRLSGPVFKTGYEFKPPDAPVALAAPGVHQRHCRTVTPLEGPQHLDLQESSARRLARWWCRRPGCRVRPCMPGWPGYEAEGLADRSHRPASCPHQMPAAVDTVLLELRLFFELAKRRVVLVPSPSADSRSPTAPEGADYVEQLNLAGVRGCPDDELWLINDVLRFVVDFGSCCQEIDRGRADLRARLTYRGQWDHRGASEINVVVAD